MSKLKFMDRKNNQSKDNYTIDICTGIADRGQETICYSW